MCAQQNDRGGLKGGKGGGGKMFGILLKKLDFFLLMVGSKVTISFE
jgi:hypothetical protein